MDISLVIAATIVVLSALVGVMLTAATLPGIWVMIAVALLCWWWQGDALFHWGTIVAAVVVGILAEVAEFLASALGAKGAGGTKWGMLGSMVGSLAGAILGTPLFPILGTIIGAVIGAGLGAIGFELMFDKRHVKESWREAVQSGKGAAIGRLLSTVIKTAFAAAAAVLLIIGAVAPVV